MAALRTELEDEIVSFLQGCPSDAEAEEFFQALDEGSVQKPARSERAERAERVERDNGAMGMRPQPPLQPKAMAPPQPKLIAMSVLEPNLRIFDESQQGVKEFGGGERLRKTCLLMLDVIRVHKFKLDQDVVRQIATNLNEDTATVQYVLTARSMLSRLLTNHRNMYSEVKGGTRLPKALGSMQASKKHSTQLVQLPQRTVDAEEKNSRTREIEQFRRREIPQGPKAGVSSRWTPYPDSRDKALKRPGAASASATDAVPMGMPKLSMPARSTDKDPDMNLEHNAPDERSGDYFTSQSAPARPAEVSLNSIVNGENSRALLNASLQQRAGEVDFGYGITQRPGMSSGFQIWIF